MGKRYYFRTLWDNIMRNQQKDTLLFYIILVVNTCNLPEIFKQKIFISYTCLINKC